MESLFTSFERGSEAAAKETLSGIMKVGMSMGDMMGRHGGMSHSRRHGRKRRHAALVAPISFGGP